MNIFFDQGLIGGISLIGNQYARANHPGLGEKFDINKPLSYIFMVDCNNQYGWAMSQYLPTGGFKWMDEDKSVEEWQDFIMNQNNEQDKGYYLKVDLEYPSNLHDSHDTFPCAPEHLKIKEEFLSDNFNYKIIIYLVYFTDINTTFEQFEILWFLTVVDRMSIKT